jgi:hypothetical protein
VPTELAVEHLPTLRKLLLDSRTVFQRDVSAARVVPGTNAEELDRLLIGVPDEITMRDDDGVRRELENAVESLALA